MIKMSTVRIDEKHQKMLNRLIAHLQLRDISKTKKKLIGDLIEQALNNEGIPLENSPTSLEEDIAWKELYQAYDLQIPDLSEQVDKFLYGEDGS